MDIHAYLSMIKYEYVEGSNEYNAQHKISQPCIDTPPSQQGPSTPQMYYHRNTNI